MPVGRCEAAHEPMSRCTGGGNAWGDLNYNSGSCNKQKDVGVSVTCSRGVATKRSSCSRKTWRGELEIASYSSSEANFFGKDPRYSLEKIFDSDMHTAWVSGAGSNFKESSNNPKFYVDFYLKVRVFKISLACRHETVHSDYAGEDANDKCGSGRYKKVKTYVGVRDEFDVEFGREQSGSEHSLWIHWEPTDKLLTIEGDRVTIHWVQTTFASIAALEVEYSSVTGSQRWRGSKSGITPTSDNLVSYWTNAGEYSAEHRLPKMLDSHLNTFWHSEGNGGMTNMRAVYFDFISRMKVSRT